MDKRSIALNLNFPDILIYLNPANPPKQTFWSSVFGIGGCYMRHGDNAVWSLVMVVVETLFPTNYMKIDIGNAITFDIYIYIDFCSAK